MKILKTPFAAVMWLSCLQLAPADTIVLKNGDKFDGKVLREVDGNYILEVKVSDTIRDEKIVAKSDVKYIDKETEDDKAFKKIEDFTPTPELLPKVAYEKRIEKVEAFISTYPESTSLSKAKKIHDYLTEEYAIVQNGGIKFGEEMVSADDYMANSYEYDATIAGKAIKKAGAELVVIEKKEKLIDKFPDLPITTDPSKLSTCNKVLCTGTTLLNDSLDEILSHCSSDAFVSIIGPTAGYFPDPLFARGVDVVGGRLVTNGAVLLQRLAEKKRWGDATQTTCFRKAIYPGLP